MSELQLTEKYRPQTLADIVGQGAVVERLSDFLEAPYSEAFIFEGDTGVGKTTAALALAFELGAVEYGGLTVIQSGDQNAEAVENAIRGLHFTPMLGSGWKVLIVEEADYSSAKASQLWLTALENLPPRSVVIFTTNHASKFPERFVHRCDVLSFESRASVILQDIQYRINQIWYKETGATYAPRAEDLPGLIRADGSTSIRHALRLLTPRINAFKNGREMPKQTKPEAKPTSKAKTEAKPEPKDKKKVSRKLENLTAAKPAQEAQSKPDDEIDYDAIYRRHQNGETLKLISETEKLNYNKLCRDLIKKGYQFPVRKKKA